MGVQEELHHHSRLHHRQTQWRPPHSTHGARETHSGSVSHCTPCSTRRTHSGRSSHHHRSCRAHPIDLDRLHHHHIEGCITTAFSTVTSFGVPGHRLVVLAQHQEERLLDLVLLQGGRLCQHQLALLAGQSRTAQEVPALHLSRQRHLVVGQPVVELVMLGAVVQQGLAAMALEAAEVLVEVARELNSIVILEGLVQHLEKLAKGIALLHILQRKRFDQLPSRARQAGDQVQDSFSFSFEQLHLGHVQGDPLSPLAVVAWGTAEQGHIVVLGHRGVTS